MSALPLLLAFAASAADAPAGTSASPALAVTGASPAPNMSSPSAPVSADDLSAALRAAAAPDSATQQAAGDQSSAAKGPPPSAEALANALASETAKASQQAEQEADAERAAAQAKHNADAFSSAEQGALPLSPSQIHDFMQHVESTQQASVPPSAGQPEPVIKVQNISLDPGSPPPQINVAVGYVTTLSILDMTGQPWPIVDIGVGGNFDIPQPEDGSHIIRISPMSRFGYGNLSVRLRDLPTPVTFKLSAGNPTVYYRYDARIPKLGPNGKVPIIQRSNPLEAGDDALMQILENNPPAGAKRLKVGGTDQRTMAWAIGSRTFLRTPLSLLSPGWNSSVSSGDGTTVYEIGTAPVVLLSDNGMLVHAKITEASSQ